MSVDRALLVGAAIARTLDAADVLAETAQKLRRAGIALQGATYASEADELNADPRLAPVLLAAAEVAGPLAKLLDLVEGLRPS